MNNIIEKSILIPKLIKKIYTKLTAEEVGITVEKIKNKLLNRHAYLSFIKAGKKKSINQYFQSLQQKEHKPKVSVIVPNYNHSDFLKKRIDSIINQTYQNFELLLLDDCSTDDSRNILTNYASNYPNKVKCIFNEVNTGNVFKQWRKGIENSTGELIWICESDDYCENDFLEKIVEQFRNPAVNIAFGRIQFCDLNDKPMKGLDSYREGAEAGIWKNTLIRPAHQWFCNGFGVNNVIANVGGCVFKKQSFEPDIWEEAESYKILGDWFLYCHIANGGLIVYEPTAVAYFRQHGSNTSVSSFQTAKYYEEHFSLMKTMKSMWNIPDKTIDKFFNKIESQYKHFNCKETLGPLENYVNKEDLKNIDSNKKHIMIALLAFHSGGGELFPLNLANELQKQGHIVSLFVFNMNDIVQEMFDLVDKRIAVYDSKFVEAYDVNVFLKDSGTSLINSHMVILDIFFLLKHKVQIKYFVTLHGSYEACNIPEDNIKQISEGVTHWIYTADRNLNALKFLNIPEKSFTKLPNAMPVDHDEFPKSREELGIQEDTVVFTLVARGIKRKGWRAAIEAFLKLEKKYSNVHLLLCGDGEETQKYKKIYNEHPKITFLGYQSKIHGLYRISNCAIVPTRFEGESYPLCIIQALQVGLPVIGTDVGEIKSMLNDKNGEFAGIILPNLRNTEEFIDHLENAMTTMLSKEIRLKYATIAEKLGKTYGMDTLAKKYMAIFESFNYKKKVYLHIGIGKTGTSSIQNMLVSNYEKLLQQGVLIPKSGLKYGMAHHGLANLQEDEFSKDTKEIYNALVDEIDSSSADKVIISSELFSYVKHGYIKQIHEFLKKYDVTIVFYVREQVKLFESGFLQNLKAGNEQLKQNNLGKVIYNFKDFCSNLEKKDFNYLIKPWEETFSSKNIKARLFDQKINNGNICNDFVEFIDLKNISIDFPVEYTNESLINDFSQLIKLIDNLEPTPNKRKKLIDSLLILSKRFRTLSSNRLIDDEEFYEKLKEYYKNSNKLFAQKYLSNEETKIFLQ